ncbi:MAG: nodulation protein NfeD, partial [Anaerolineae bacterium]|nr:nodulation protein NfeD [Anaerolineae bacterium]
MRARKITVAVVIAIVAAVALLASSSTGARAAGRFILLLEADGPVAPVMQGYIARGITYAEENAAEAVIIRLNTPGGNLSTTEAIISNIRSTRTPVIVYVAPPGALAASAGTLITLAGHAAAMAPDTVIGAASPINLDGSDLNETSAEKAQQVTAATARGLAERRGAQAVELAVATITEARAASAAEALDAGLIDFIAGDVEALLAQLDSYRVEVFGQPVTLHTAGLPVETLALTPLEQVLQVLTDPTLVFTLLSLGTLLIIIEFNAPGGWAAGTLGFIAVALAFYGLGVLPINWLGIAFVALAVILFILEAQNPATTGILALAGGVSLVAGAVILFSRPELAAFGELALPVVIAQAAVTAGVFIFFISRGLMAVRMPPATGAEGLVGQIAEARTDLAPEGMVFVEGERWQAVCRGAHVKAGERVRVVAVEKL